MQTQEIKCKILPLTRSSHVVTVEEKKKKVFKSGEATQRIAQQEGPGTVSVRFLVD